jgi:MerR family transcriptional regulator, light-induced transcriptional regulator
MNVFTIRDIENLCNIKAHTLRIWEQRYNIVCPKRKPGKHRMYDNDDLKYLLRIAYLYHHGHKISKIAKYSEQEICELAVRVSSKEDAEEIFINQLSEASIDLNQERFEKILNNIIIHFGFEKSMVKVIFPFLHKIGLLWMTGNVIPSQEHFASALVTKKIHVANNGLENHTAAGSKKILLFTPCGEFHEIPLLFMKYLMKRNGIAVTYFGTNIPLKDIEYYCSHRPVTHLHFHLVTNLIKCELDDYLEKIATTFPEKQIVVSGPKVHCITKSFPNVRVLKSFEEVFAFACEVR